MDETIDWLLDRPYYDDQLADRRTIAGRRATHAEVALDARLADALAALGIESLYTHQARAIEAIREGSNVVLATPTASGKSLAYTIPAFERALTAGGTTLYIAPQVALINDQEQSLSAIADNLGFGHPVGVEQYTGRLSRTEREAVRDRRPTTLLTTPDMIHYSLLPHARRLWDWLFDNLTLVVVDEVHEYRGVFGSHVGLVFRRLARLCSAVDSDPQFVCCSATIGNPREHAANVTARPPFSFQVIEADTSPSGPTHWLLWNPPEYTGKAAVSGSSGRRRSSHVEANRLFVDLIAAGHQTVVFTRARQTAERYAMEASKQLRDRSQADIAENDLAENDLADTDLVGAVTAYQAALNTARRQEIEMGLAEGTIRGVWSTNALELGVDIGGLDAVVLDGYPGTRMATHQRAGRAGRGERPSLVVLVAGEDQLDQYVMNHPDELFDGDPERAVANPENEHLLADHIPAAARESWLTPEDADVFGDSFADVVAQLDEAGELERRNANEGIRWVYAGDGSPQHEMSLRTFDEREIILHDRRTGERIGTLSFSDALRDVHPGAIYHHQGTTYEVVDLDLSTDVAELEPVRANHYTQVLHEKDITVDQDLIETTLEARADVPVRFADITMTKQITGYERRDKRTGETLGEQSLDLPETTLETRALYFALPDELKHNLQAKEGSFPGAIHAAEHAMIGLFPLQLVCDRRDIGGLSTPLHRHTDRSTIFIYDGYPGGVGLVRAGFDRIERLLEDTRRLLRGCDCDDGCPSCVQSPHCGNANEPLDKALALELLDRITTAPD